MVGIMVFFKGFRTMNYDDAMSNKALSLGHSLAFLITA